jgi:hypothetical protein
MFGALYSAVGCSQILRKCKLFAKWLFSPYKLRVSSFLTRHISCKTLECPQLDLGPVETAVGPKMAMLAKSGLLVTASSQVTVLSNKSLKKNICDVGIVTLLSDVPIKGAVLVYS